MASCCCDFPWAFSLLGLKLLQWLGPGGLSVDLLPFYCTFLSVLDQYIPWSPLWMLSGGSGQLHKQQPFH